MLPEAARYDTLLNLPSGASLGGALVFLDEVRHAGRARQGANFSRRLRWCKCGSTSSSPTTACGWGDPAAVWVPPCLLSGLEEEHGTADDLVGLVKPVDDARQIAANTGTCAPENVANSQKWQKYPKNDAMSSDLAEDFNQKSTNSNNQDA